MPDQATINGDEKDNRILARCAVRCRGEGVIEIADLRIDPFARGATHKGESLILTPMEFELLLFLARNPGRGFTREELLRDVWGLDAVEHRHTVAVNIGWLRAKLGDPGRLIQTAVGGGYRLVAPRGARH